MTKVLILDVYPNKPFRISKDQNGGYGTANDYGDSFVLKILNNYVKKNIDYPPLYSVYSAGQLRANGFEVEYSKTLNNKTNFDLYVLPSSIVCHETEVENVKKLNKLGKKIFVIGPFATACPENYVKNGAKVISGEPELFFYDFKLSNFNNFENLENIIFFKSSLSLDDLHLPAWDIIFKSTTPIMSFLGKGSTIPIHASRGCPYSCVYYCTYPVQQGRKLRFRNTDNILSEMLHWNSKFGTKNFIFRDPVFSINHKHATELLNKIAKSKIKFNICIETHLKNIDDELIKLFKKAGIKLIYVGIESGDKEVLIDSKRTTIEFDDQIKKVREIEKNNIKVKCMYIIGLPSDNSQTCNKTIAYSRRIFSSYAQFSVFTPYPGTPVFLEYKEKILTKKYEDFNQWKMIFKHASLSQKMVRSLLNKAYLTYYFNPKWIIYFITKKIFFKN